MAKIDLQKFGGRVPKISARLLEQHQSQTALNCDFRTGKLVPFAAPTQATDHSSAVPKTLWKMGSSRIIFPDGEENTVVDSPIDESNNRIFWTDGSLPKQSDDTLWGEGTWWRRLGVKPPAVAPTVTVSGSAGDDVQDYVSYVFTMVTTWGEESAPSSASAVATVMSDQYVDLSVMTTPSTSYNTYQYKRIYRLSSGTQGAEYQFLAQIAYGDTTYQDKAAGNALADVDTDLLPTEGWALPPDNLIYLTACHNGIFAGASGKELYLSEPNYPYAWPTDYVRVFDTDIQGIGAFGQYIVVITKNWCYVLSGLHPLSMSKKTMGNPQGCLNARGVISTEFGVFYPSADGMCLCDGRSVRVTTKNWITKAQWIALSPSNLVAAWYDNKYYGFFSGTDDGIIYDMDIGELAQVEFDTPLDKIYDVYADLSTETLYILCTNTAGDNGYTYSFETAGTDLTYTWLSKVFARSDMFTCAKIEANFGANTVTFKWYEDGALKQTKSVTTSTGTFRLPASGYSEEKSFQLEGAVEIYRVQIASSPKEIGDGN